MAYALATRPRSSDRHPGTGRQILAVEMANRERGSSWKGFLFGLRRRGLDRV
jgi:hypothetical protein